MDWQPIETAPRDGSTILAWHHIYHCPIAVFWRESPSLWPEPWIEKTYSNCWPEAAFTHWAPLPEPPGEDN